MRLLHTALLGALLLGVALAGCGKSLPQAGQGRGAGVVTVAGSGRLAANGLATKNTTRLGGANPVADAAAVALAVHPGLSPATRPGAVVLVDKHNWPAALAAAALASAPLSAPLLYAEGDTLPAISAEALRSMRPMGEPVLRGVQVIEIGTSAAPAVYRTRSLAGPAGGASDATAGTSTAAGTSSAAGSSNAASTSNAGGTSTVSGSTAAAGVAGGTGTGTAGVGAGGSGSAINASARLAARIERILASARGAAPRRVIVVGADGPPALAMPAAGLAAETGAPILPVARRGIPSATRHVLAGLRGPAIYVVGPPAAVSDATLAQLGHYGTVRRIAPESLTPLEGSAAGSPTEPGGGGAGTEQGAAAGTPTAPAPAANVGGTANAEAVANAIAVARYSDGSFGWGVEEPGHGLVFANAARPLDAPAAASLSASGDFGPLLLLEGPGGVPSTLAKYLSDIQPSYPEYEPTRGFYNHGWLIGDEAAVSLGAQAEVDTMLETLPHSAASSPKP